VIRSARRAPAARQQPFSRSPAGSRRSARSYLKTGTAVTRRISNLFRNLVVDERGGEVIEYVLIAGLIVVATIVVIGAVGTKVLARWNSVNDGM
jgi:Flp pilus assembly pilin Flp